MKTLITAYFSLFGVLWVTNGTAQDFSAQVREKISTLQFIHGTWEGRGWIMSPSGEKAYSNVTEDIGTDVAGTVLKLRGTGTTDEGEVVHDALGIIYYDPFRNAYKMESFVGRGFHTTADVVLPEPGVIVWSFDAGPNMRFRYTIRIEGDSWIETGEMSQDKTTFRQFFEMKLTRK